LPDTFGGGVLQITDAEFSGEQFIIVDIIGSLNNIVNTVIGTTSDPAQPDEGIFCGFDPDTCFITNGISSGSFRLSPGSHSFFVFVTGLNGAGTGFFRVVPEPSILLLLAMGIFALHRSRSFARTKVAA